MNFVLNKKFVLLKVILDLFSAQLREACRDIRKLAAEGKDINEMRKTKQKYITDVSNCTHTQHYQ